VVATRVGGIPDMIDQGESGWLVAPNDFADIATRLEQILARPGELERMGLAARARAVEKMALSDAVEGIAQLLARLVPTRTTQREISAVVSDGTRRRVAPTRAAATANGTPPTAQ
jgi:hypothetical protein